MEKLTKTTVLKVMKICVIVVCNVWKVISENIEEETEK